MENIPAKQIADDIEELLENAAVYIQRQVNPMLLKMRAEQCIDLYGFVMDRDSTATFFHCNVPAEEIRGIYASTGEVLIRKEVPLTHGRLYPSLALAKNRASHRVANRIEKLRAYSRSLSTVTTNDVSTIQVK
ncbi:UNVERIFIED: hypothetical protein OPA17_24 [Vibrio phage OPA17]|nr:hypothetical protein OTA22_24 [Vibrio phage OTA22]